MERSPHPASRADHTGDSPLIRFLFQPVDISSLVFFRVVFGILGFADILGTWSWYHLHLGYFRPGRFNFTFYGFEWVKPFPEPLMSLFFVLLMIAALGIAAGKWYRISTVLFFLGFTYTFLLEKANYLNHGYLFCWISFLMIFLPAHRNVSLDVLRRPQLKRAYIPYWPVVLLCLLMGIVYFFGGIAKLNPDWLRAVPLKFWLADKADFPVLGYLYQFEITAWLMAYAGLFLDLFVVFLLLDKRSRPWAFGFAAIFHALNFFTFNIGIFPFLSLALTALFFPPDFPRRILERLAGHLPRLRRWIDGWRRRSHYQGPLAPLWQEARPNRTFITASLILLTGIHLSLPLRHHLYPGEVAWTEEGHRYAWRMMLRSKNGYGDYIIRHSDGRTTHLKPRRYLRRKQLRKLYTHPDMILQFAHHLRDSLWAGGDTVAIFAEIKTKLNGEKYQLYINPEVDLTRVEWSFFRPSPWIVPLEPAPEN